jgi:hypothetical protein
VKYLNSFNDGFINSVAGSGGGVVVSFGVVCIADNGNVMCIDDIIGFIKMNNTL